MKTTLKSLSTSELRRDSVIRSAIVAFADSGFLGTPITEVAKGAMISPAYVFKLFPTKEQLFVAALERCFKLVRSALADGANSSVDQTPEAILDAMGAAYASLITDRDLLMLQVHAQSASKVPEIAAAFRQGLQETVDFVKNRSAASDEAVQRFFAYGQLCHLISTLSLTGDAGGWARLLTQEMRHPE